jgi:MFS family permease
LLGWFLLHEARVAKAPLMPLSLFRMRAVSAANLVMFLLGAAVFGSWFFMTLYMQNVLGYSPLKAGLAFLPNTLAIVVGAQLSARIVGRLGPRTLLLAGPLISASGLFWLSQISVDSGYLFSICIPSVLMTFGVGLSFTPIAIAATSGVPPELAGLASGMINTMRQVGGGIGLAVLATVAEHHTRSAGGSLLEAQTAGYGLAFFVAGAFGVLAAASATLLPRPPVIESVRTINPPAGAYTAPAVAVPEASPQGD